MNVIPRYRSLILIVAVALSSSCLEAATCESTLIDGARYHLPGVMAVIARDVDSDGRPDLVAATTNSTSLAVLTNGVDGFFRNAPIAVGHLVLRLFEADVDGDGNEEIIATGLNTVSTLFANPDGTYRVVASPVTILTNVSAIGDLTSDGKFDLAAFGQDRILRIYAGSSNGTFALIGASPAPIGTRLAYSLAVAELTGDTKGDLVILGNFGTVIYPGNGDGTFAAQHLIASPGAGNLKVATGDFDGDARADIIARFSPGHGTFFSSTNGHTTSKAIACAGTAQTVDLDGDGKLDTVSDVLEICRGNGNGTFDERWDGATYFIDQVSANQTVSVADFDGDGRLDVAGATKDEDIAIFHGKPNLQLSGSHDYPLAPASLYAETADVNNDGRDDIITSGFDDLYVFVAQPDGTFTRTTTYSGFPHGPAVAADLNDDQKLDLFLGSAALIGQGDGTFQPMSLPSSTDFESFAAADMNGDQKTDFVGATEQFGGSSRVVVWLRNESGTLTETLYPMEPFGITRLTVADVTGDSIPDVLILGQNQTEQGSLTLRMLPGRADGTLGPSIMIAGGIVSNDVLAAKFDGDSIADLVFAVQTATAGDALLILRATGNGMFAERQRIPLPANAEFGRVRLAAGDFDGDGRRDIAAVIPDYPITWVLLQNVHSMFALGWSSLHVPHDGPAVAGDFNNDGVDDLVVLSSSTNMDVHISACRDALPAVPPRVEMIGATRSAKGQPVTFTASIDSPDAHGSIVFYSRTRSGATLLGTVPLSSGHAALTLSFSDLGQRKVYAIYTGEGRHARAMSNVLVHDVLEPTSLPRRRGARR